MAGYGSEALQSRSPCMTWGCTIVRLKLMALSSSGTWATKEFRDLGDMIG
jgi:hypothetical protein